MLTQQRDPLLWYPQRYTGTGPWSWEHEPRRISFGLLHVRMYSPRHSGSTKSISLFRFSRHFWPSGTLLPTTTSLPTKLFTPALSDWDIQLTLENIRMQGNGNPLRVYMPNSNLERKTSLLRPAIIPQLHHWKKRSSTRSRGEESLHLHLPPRERTRLEAEEGVAWQQCGRDGSFPLQRAPQEEGDLHNSAGNLPGIIS